MKLITHIIAFGSYFAVFLLILNRNFARYKEVKNWNWSQFLLATTIFLFCVQILVFIIVTDVLKSDDVNPVLISLSLMLSIMSGLTFVFYINKWEKFLYSPLFLFVGSLYLYLADQWLIFYYIVGGLGSIIIIVALYQTGIELKDNKVLGLAIMFTFSLFSALFIPFTEKYLFLEILRQMLIYGSVIFAILISFNKFKFYKLESLD